MELHSKTEREKKSHNKNEARKRETVTHFMSRFFRKKTNPYNLRSKGKLRGENTPPTRVDACVETDLPFDESDIATEVRQGPTAEKDTDSEPLENHQRDSDKFNKTNLELVDISEVSTSEYSSDSLAPPCLGNTQDTEEINTLTEEIDIFQEEEKCYKDRP